MEVRDTVQETGIKTIPMEKKSEKAKWLSASSVKAALIVNPVAFAQNSRVLFFLPILNPGAHFSSLVVNVSCGILFFFSPEQDSCSGRNPFSSIIFLMALGNWSTTSLLAEASFPVLIFFKPILSLKWSNHPLPASKSPALDPSPSFCFFSSFVNLWIFLSYSNPAST